METRKACDEAYAAVVSERKAAYEQRQKGREDRRERKIEEQTEEWLRQLRDRTYVEYRSEELGAAAGKR